MKQQKTKINNHLTTTSKKYKLTKMDGIKTMNTTSEKNNINIGLHGLYYCFKAIKTK